MNNFGPQEHIYYLSDIVSISLTKLFSNDKPSFLSLEDLLAISKIFRLFKVAQIIYM